MPTPRQQRGHLTDLKAAIKKMLQRAIAKKPNLDTLKIESFNIEKEEQNPLKHANGRK